MLRALYGWRETAIVTYSLPADRPALLAALRAEQQAAERALREKRRRERQAWREEIQRAAGQRAETGPIRPPWGRPPEARAVRQP